MYLIIHNCSMKATLPTLLSNRVRLIFPFFFIVISFLTCHDFLFQVMPIYLFNLLKNNLQGQSRQKRYWTDNADIRIKKKKKLKGRAANMRSNNKKQQDKKVEK